MTSAAPERRLRRLLLEGRDYLTHWAIAGALIAITGFAPEHWVAGLLERLSLPEALRHAGRPAFDLRIALVAVGVAIVAWDVLRRSRATERPAGSPTLRPDVVGGPRVGGAAERRLPAANGPPLTLPDKPSIAVLPFTNMSNDPEQDYFADGMAEDIITALSRFRQFFVIARNSSFTYKGRAVDVKQVGRELGVRYVLEGSVRRVASRVRITGELIDTTTGAHLWADRFDGALEDVFDLQDQVTTSVVGVIAPTLERAEIERATNKRTESLDAYDYYLRGMARLYRWTKEETSEALRLFQRAIELDPGFSSAYGMAAWCYVWRKANGWMGDRARETAEAAALAWRAVDLGADDAIALLGGGYALVFVVHELDTGAAHIDRALALNPNLAWGLTSSGWTKAFLGRPEEAIEQLTRAMRLSPLDPLSFRTLGGIAFSHLLAGRYDEAASWAERALRERHTYLPAVRDLAAALALAGRQLEARKAIAHLCEVDPAMRVSRVKEWVPFRRPEDLARLEEGLRRAGLPE